jgi:hypothetical protein
VAGENETLTGEFAFVTRIFASVARENKAKTAEFDVI